MREPRAISRGRTGREEQPIFACPAPAEERTAVDRLLVPRESPQQRALLDNKTEGRSAELCVSIVSQGSDI